MEGAGLEAQSTLRGEHREGQREGHEGDHGPDFQERDEADPTARIRPAYPAASCGPSYFVLGQKKPRRPSPLVRGTTWTCRCATDCDTLLFIATNDPPAPSPLSTAARNYRRALDQLTQEAGLAA